MTSNEVYYDVLPDGTLGDPIDFTDGEALAKLLIQRMSPENLKACSFEMVVTGFKRDYHRTLETLGMLTMESQREIITGVSERLRAEASAA